MFSKCIFYKEEINSKDKISLFNSLLVCDLLLLSIFTL